jgi:hypothetical protein
MISNRGAAARPDAPTHWPTHWRAHRRARLRTRRLRRHAVRRACAHAGELLRQVKGEGAADAFLTLDVEFAVQQPRDFTADGQSQPGAAVAPGGAGVGLLERLENELALFRRDADAGVADTEGHHQRRMREARIVWIPAAARDPRRQRDATPAAEFERVRQQVGQHLFHALAIGAQDRRQVRLEGDRERETLGLGLVAEALVEFAGQRGGDDVADLEGGAAGLDLGQIEDVVDQVQQVASGCVHDLDHFKLLVGQVLLAVLAQLLSQQQQAVQGRTQLMRHVREEFRLVLRGERQLFGLFLQAVAGLLDLAVLAFDFRVLLGQLARPAFQFGVGLPQLALLRLEFAFQHLRLLPQQHLGAGGGLDRIEHDSQALGQLVEKGQVDRLERFEGGQLDHRLDLALEQDRQHHQVARAGLAEAGHDLDVILRQAGDQEALLFEGRLADDPLADMPVLRQVFAFLVAVAGHQGQQRGGSRLGLAMARHLHQVQHGVLGRHERRQLRQQHARHGHDVALTLQHAGQAREVGLEPVLLGIALGGLLQVADHLVDVVLQVRHLAARGDLDRAPQVTLGHGGRHFTDRAHLGRQVGRQFVDVVDQVAPAAGRARHHRLAAQPPLDPDFARHPRDLVAEGGQGVDHVIDGVGQGRHLALGRHQHLLLQVADRDPGHHLGHAAHLVGEVGRHQVDAVGQVLPDAGGAHHLRLAAELALGADLARHPRHLARKTVELVEHRVDGVGVLEEFAAQGAAVHFKQHVFGQDAARHRADHPAHLAHRLHQVVDHRVDRVDFLAPGAVGLVEHHALAQLAFGAHRDRDLLDRTGQPAVGRHDIVDGIGDLAVDAVPVVWQAHAEVAGAQCHERLQQQRPRRLVGARRGAAALPGVQVLGAPGQRAAGVGPALRRRLVGHHGWTPIGWAMLNGPRRSRPRASSPDTAGLK